MNMLQEVEQVRLREIPEAIRTRMEEYNSEECTDERRLELEIELEHLEYGFEGFVESLCTVVAENEANAELFTPEIERLTAKRTTALARAERTRRYIDVLLRRKQVKKISAGLFDLSFRKSEAVVVEALPELLPEQYRRVKYEADKTAIKQAIKNGEIIEGARIEERQNLQIK